MWDVVWCGVVWDVRCGVFSEMWCGVVWDVECGPVSPPLSHIVRSLTQSECAEFPGPVSTWQRPAAPHHHALLQCTLLQCCTTPTQTVHTKPDIWTHDVMYTTVQCALCSSYCNCGGDTGQEVTVGLHSGWWVVCEWWWLMVVSEWWHAAGSRAPAAWPGLGSAP